MIPLRIGDFPYIPDVVVHCKRDEYDVYIGRPSKWGNPYSHKPGTLARYQVNSVEEAIEAYRQHLWRMINDNKVSLRELAELHNKRLGCWCAPNPCHGEVLTKAAKWAAKQLDNRQ